MNFIYDDNAYHIISPTQGAMDKKTYLLHLVTGIAWLNQKTVCHWNFFSKRAKPMTSWNNQDIYNCFKVSNVFNTQIFIPQKMNR